MNLAFKSWTQVTSYPPSLLYSLSVIAAFSVFLMHIPLKKVFWRVLDVLNGHSLSKLWEVEKDREAWRAAVHGIAKNQTWLNNWTTTTTTWKVVDEPWKTPGFLASRGEEFNPGPETRLDHSELLCNKVLLKYKRDRESFWYRHQKGAEGVPPDSL